MEINNLSKEDKIKLIQHLQAKQAKNKEKLDNYKPNDGQLPVHSCRAKYRYVFSGNAMGKTALAVHEAVWAARGYNPVSGEYTSVPARVVVVLDHPKKVAEQWLPEINKWFDTSTWKQHKDGKPHVSRISLPTGSEILFGFHEQPPLAWEGVEITAAIFDEPPPRQLYVALIRGGRIKGQKFKCLLIGTPISCSWLRQQILEPWMKGELKEVECFRASSDVNRHNLQDGYLESFFGHLTEEERKIRREGQFFDLGSLALAHLFQRKKHIISRPAFERAFSPTHHPCVVAIDPHSSKPHYAILIGANNDGDLFYIKEIARKCVPRKFAKELKEFMKGFYVVDIICDSAGNAEMTGGDGYKSFAEVLRNEGIRLRTTSFREKDDEEFINKIRNILSIPEKPNNFGMYTPKLRIVEGNSGIIRDIENVGWQRSRDGELKDKLDIRNQDYLACLKYGLASGISSRSGKRTPQKYGPKKKSLYGFKRRK